MRRPKPPDKPERPAKGPSKASPPPGHEQEIHLDADRWSGFRDSFGEREVGIDAEGRPIELLRLVREFTPVEQALSDRMGRLMDFDRPTFARPLRVEQDDQKRRPRLVLVSERVPGVRLSELLVRGIGRSRVPDLGAALFVMHRLLSTASSLQSTTGLTHFIVAPERVVITPRGEVVVVEAALAGAVEALAASSGIPKGLQLAWADADAQQEGPSVDIARIARIGISMMRGRALDADEYVDALSPVLGDVTDVAAIRAGDAFSIALRLWLEQAITIDADASFPDFQQAGIALDRTNPPTDCVASRVALQAFLHDLAIEDLSNPETAALEADRIRAIRARQIATRPFAAEPRTAWIESVAHELGLPHKDEILQESPEEIAAKPLEIVTETGVIDMTDAVGEIAEDSGSIDITEAAAELSIEPVEAAPKESQPIKESVIRSVADRFGFVLRDEVPRKPPAEISPNTAETRLLVTELEEILQPRETPSVETPSAREPIAPEAPPTTPTAFAEAAEAEEPALVEPLIEEPLEAVTQETTLPSPAEMVEETAVKKRGKRSWFRAVATQFGLRDKTVEQQPALIVPAPVEIESTLFETESVPVRPEARIEQPEEIPEAPVPISLVEATETAEAVAANVEEPVIEESAIEEPVIEEPAIEEPVIEEPAIEEPVLQATSVAEIASPWTPAIEEAAPAHEQEVEEAEEPEPLEPVAEMFAEPVESAPVVEEEFEQEFEEEVVEETVETAPAESRNLWIKSIAAELGLAPQEEVVREPAPPTEAPPPVVPAPVRFEPPPARPQFPEPVPLRVRPLEPPAPPPRPAPWIPKAPAPPRVEAFPAVAARSIPIAPSPPASTQVPRATPAPRPARGSRLPDIAAAAGQFMRAAAIFVVSVGLVGGLAWAGRQYYARKTTPGTVVIESNPRGAEIFVDGASKGLTPITIELSPGTHEFELRRRGVPPRQFTLDVSPGEQLKQQIDLSNTRAVGTLVVNSNPKGVKVLVDGKPRGVTPLTLSDLSVGAHKVALESAGGSIDRDVQIRAGGKVTLDESIFSGWITVFAPFELQVYEGKRLLGTTENERIMLPSGRHELELVNTRRGFRETRAVDVSPGATVPVNVQSTEGTVRINAPAGAEVLIDGERVGETPLAELQVLLGTREIVVRHPQLGEKRITVTVTSSAPAEVNVDFDKP